MTYCANVLRLLSTLAAMVGVPTLLHADQVLVAKEAVAARLDACKQIDVQYSIRNTYILPDQGKAMADQLAGQGISLKEGDEDSQCRFSFLDGRVRYEDVPVAGRTSRPSVFQIHSRNRAEILIKSAAAPRGLGVIADQRALPACLLDVALGLRNYRNEMWNARDQILTWTWKEIDAARFEATATSKKRVHRILYDSKHEYAIVKYTVYPEGKDQAHLELVCGDFRRVGTTLVPHLIEAQEFNWRVGNPAVVVKSQIKITKCTFDNTENKQELYEMVWPKGSSVKDTRLNETFQVESEDRRLSDNDIREIVEKRVGKPKPENRNE